VKDSIMANIEVPQGSDRDTLVIRMKIIVWNAFDVELLNFCVKLI
jgi:hypothetical protein